MLTAIWACNKAHMKYVYSSKWICYKGRELCLDNSKGYSSITKILAMWTAVYLCTSPALASNFDACRTPASTDALVHVQLDETVPNSDCEGNT